jgi:hypothetical protein
MKLRLLHARFLPVTFPWTAMPRASTLFPELLCISFILEGGRLYYSTGFVSFLNGKTIFRPPTIYGVWVCRNDSWCGSSSSLTHDFSTAKEPHCIMHRDSRRKFVRLFGETCTRNLVELKFVFFVLKCRNLKCPMLPQSGMHRYRNLQWIQQLHLAPK